MKLTSRQLEIVRARARGTPAKGIAADLGLHRKTIDYHWAKIQRISGFQDVVAVVRWALRRGLAD